MKVAILGTGLMGGAVAERLCDRGHQTVVWNRTREKAEALRAFGAMVAETPPVALRDSQAVLILLKDGPAIREVLLKGECLAALEGRTAIGMSTIAPTTSREVAERVAAAGANYLEVPVLGSTPQARAGELIQMVAGDEDQFHQWKPLLTDLGKDPIYLGEVGMAASLKLALNALLVSLVASFSLSLGMVLEAGVPLEPFVEIVRSSSLHSPQFDKKLPRMLERDFSDPHFPVSHMLKDVDLALAEAERLGLGAESLRGIRTIVERALEMGYVDVDYSALYNAVYPSEGS